MPGPHCGEEGFTLYAGGVRGGRRGVTSSHTWGPRGTPEAKAGAPLPVKIDGVARPRSFLFFVLFFFY